MKKKLVVYYITGPQYEGSEPLGVVNGVEYRWDPKHAERLNQDGTELWGSPILKVVPGYYERKPVPLPHVMEEIPEELWPAICVKVLEGGKKDEA